MDKVDSVDKAREALRERGLTSRGLAVRSATANAEARTVEAVLTTDAPTMVFDWKRWEPIEEVLAMGGAVVPESRQVVMLANHSRWSLDDVAGSVRDVRIEGGRMVGTLHFAEDADSERAWQKVRAGHITDVSVGYRVTEYTDIEPGKRAVVNGREYAAGKYALRVSTRWELKEASLVPIGADPGAKIREEAGAEPAGKEKRMETKAGAPVEPEEQQREAPPANNVTDLASVRREAAAEAQRAAEAALAAERERVAAIRKLAGDDVNSKLVLRAIEEGWTVERAKDEIIAAFRAAVPGPVPAAPEIIVRGGGTSREALAAGLAMRAGLWREKPGMSDDEKRAADAGQRLADLTLLDICREALRVDGRSVPYSRAEAIQEAIRSNTSTGTLSFIFTTSIHAAVMQGFDEAANTWQAIATTQPVSNFQTQERGRMEKQRGMTKTPRGIEAEHGRMSDLVETYKVARYAQQAVIDEQDMLDDNVGLLASVPREFGLDAGRLLQDLVWAELMSNPTMRDSVTLFDISGNTHNNYAEGAGTTLQASTLQTAIQTMMKQTENNVILGVMPRTLIVPPSLLHTARQLVNSSEVRDTTASKVFGTSNPLRDDNLTVLAEPRLEVGLTDPETGTTHTGSTTAWYLAAAPGSAPLIELGYVGSMAPSVRSWTLDKGGRWGVGYDIKSDKGARALDWRGFYKSKGAA